MSAELLAPGLAIGAAFESAYPVAKGNYYDIEARIITLHTLLSLHYRNGCPHLISVLTTDWALLSY